MFMSFSGTPIWRRKPTETSVFEFSYLCVISSLKELIKVKVIFILRQGKTPFEPKICLYKGFLGALVSHESRNSEEAIVS